jgi:hypothetical protein
MTFIDSRILKKRFETLALRVEHHVRVVRGVGGTKGRVTYAHGGNQVEWRVKKSRRKEDT